MQFRVVIPENVKEGQTIRIRCPDGTEADVKIPGGLKPGDPFLFDISVDQLTNPQALLETLKENSMASSSLSKSKGFLERDIVSMNDLLLALSVGLIIGLGIIVGFIVGILYATRNFQADIAPMHSIK